MSLTGSGPDDPQRVGRADRRPARRHVRRLRRARRAASSGSAPGEGTVVRTSLLAAIVGVHAFQGTRWTVAGEVGRAPGQPPPVDRALRAVPLPPTAPCRSRVGSEGLWRRFCAGFGLDPATPRAGDQPRAGRRTASRSIAVVEAAFADCAGRAAARPGSPRSASPRARCARSTRSTRGTRSPARGCSIEVEHAHARPAHAARAAAALLRRRRRRGDPRRARRAADARPARRRRTRLAGARGLRAARSRDSV